MTTSFYRLTEKLLKKLNVNVCFRCEREFKAGDDVVSRGSKGPRTYYHQRCYNAMFIEV
jgi:hypothetical protein